MWIIFCFVASMLMTNVGGQNSELLCTHFRSGSIHAVTIRNSNLYLIVNANLYSIPFTTDYINSTKGSLILYKQTGSLIIDHGLWFKDEMLKAVADRISDIKQLRRIDFIPDAQSKWHVYTVYGEKSNHVMFDADKKEVELGTNLEPFAVWPGADKNSGYVLREYNSTEDRNSAPVVLVPGATLEKANSTPTQLYTATVTRSEIHFRYYNTLTNSGKLSFEGSPLVTNPSTTFGFITPDHKIHYWDLSEKEVIIFDDPERVNKNSNNLLAIKFKSIPMSKYFVCNQPEANMPTVLIAGPESSTDNNKGFIVWLIVVSIIAMLLFILLCGSVVVGVLLGMRRKKLHNSKQKSNLYQKGITKRKKPDYQTFDPKDSFFEQASIDDTKSHSLKSSDKNSSKSASNSRSTSRKAKHKKNSPRDNKISIMTMGTSVAPMQSLESRGNAPVRIVEVNSSPSSSKVHSSMPTALIAPSDYENLYDVRYPNKYKATKVQKTLVWTGPSNSGLGAPVSSDSASLSSALESPIARGTRPIELHGHSWASQAYSKGSTPPARLPLPSLPPSIAGPTSSMASNNKKFTPGSSKSRSPASPSSSSNSSSSQSSSKSATTK